MSIDFTQLRQDTATLLTKQSSNDRITGEELRSAMELIILSIETSYTEGADRSLLVTNAQVNTASPGKFYGVLLPSLDPQLSVREYSLIVARGGDEGVIRHIAIVNKNNILSLWFREGVLVSDQRVFSAWQELIGGGGASTQESVFVSDLTVNLENERSFGKYKSGDTIPSTGKTAAEVIAMSIFESKIPQVSGVVSGSIPYNSISRSLSISIASSSNNPGSLITNLRIFYKRGGGLWSTTPIYNGDPITTFVHNIDSELIANNSQSFKYKIEVIDSLNATASIETNTITPQSYSAPTTNINISSLRELGDIETAIIGTVSQPTQNDVLITSIEIQYSLDNSTWEGVSTDEPLTTAINHIHNDISLVNASTIFYRLQVINSTPDGEKVANLNIGVINFVYLSTFGYLESTPSLEQLLEIGNSILTNGKSRTVNSATASSAQYTYIVYRAAAGDLSSITMDGVAAILGAFTKQADIEGVNSFGADVTYRVYKSNAPGAFTNNKLVIL